MRSSQGGFSVAWEQYGSVMCAGFQELQQRAEFVDMTIAADGHLVRVHQMVVGLASPFLKELLRSAPSPNPVLFLNNVSHKMLCCILEYMYTGEALVLADDLKTFIATGKALRVRGLEEMMVPEAEEHAVVEEATTLVQAASSNTQDVTIAESVTLDDQKHANITEIDKPRSRNNTECKSSHRTIHKDKITIHSRKRNIKKPVVTDLSPVPTKISKQAKTVEVFSDDEGEDHWTHSADEDDDVRIRNEPNQEGEIDALEEQGSRVKKVELMFTTSNQGARQLILNRYLYRLRHTYKDGRIRWECVDNIRKKCHGTVITMDNTFVARYSAHNHAFHDRRIMGKVKQNAVFTSIEKVELNREQIPTD